MLEPRQQLGLGIGAGVVDALAAGGDEGVDPSFVGAGDLDVDGDTVRAYDVGSVSLSGER